MNRILHPLEKYLLHCVVIIDTDQSEVDFLVRALSTPSATFERASFETIVVSTIGEAEAYMERRAPTIAIIDPGIESVENILEFVAKVRDVYPNVAWLINTTDSWWSTNAQALEIHSFGARLQRYYKRTKGSDEANARKTFLDILNLCRHDLLLDLIKGSANELQSAGDKVTPEQLDKFVSKLVKPVLLLVVEEHGISPKSQSKVALVSTGHDSDQKRRYNEVLAPTLIDLGYTPVTMQAEFSPRPNSDAFFAAIHEASLFVADLTDSRSLMFEIGAALASAVPLIFVAHCSKITLDDLPITSARIESTSDEDLREKLTRAVAAISGSGT